MIHHLIVRICFVGSLVVCALLALLHVFPFILIALAVIGIYKLYQAFKGPKFPPGSRR